jgi:hypothetical protein
MLPVTSSEMMPGTRSKTNVTVFPETHLKRNGIPPVVQTVFGEGQKAVLTNEFSIISII